jgi:hypothetical protein
MKHLLFVLGSLSLVVACGCGSSPKSEPESPSPAAPSEATSPAAPSEATAPAAPDAPPGAPKVSADGSCGGIQGLACPDKQYCSYPLDARCGAADQMGKCTPIADMCTQQFDPVCGCNDKTYPNDCYAAREGISVAKKGECAK